MTYAESTSGPASTVPLRRRTADRTRHEAIAVATRAYAMTLPISSASTETPGDRGVALMMTKGTRAAAVTPMAAMSLSTRDKMGKLIVTVAAIRPMSVNVAAIVSGNVGLGSYKRCHKTHECNISQARKTMTSPTAIQDARTLGRCVCSIWEVASTKPPTNTSTPGTICQGADETQRTTRPIVTMLNHESLLDQWTALIGTACDTHDEKLSTKTNAV